MLLPFALYAADNSDTTTISVSLGSTISISTTGTVSIDVTPVTGGSQSSASDTVTVSTNNATGYNLTLADSDADTDLVHENETDTITAHDGTFAAPTALDNNTWGYAIAGGDFDESYSTINNAASSTTKWAGVPASGDEDTLKTTNDTASDDATTVWFSVKADTSNPNGDYSDTVTYTATTNN